MSGRRGSTKETLAGHVWRVMMQYGQTQWMRASQELQEIGLTPGHLRLLLHLDPDDPRPMGALAQECSCDASTMTWLVDRMEERGLVVRRGMQGDRRVKTVVLTAEGLRMRERAHEQLFRPPARLAALARPTLESLLETFSAQDEESDRAEETA